MTTSEELRRQAQEADQQAEESFQRCDTDGFLSQWASGITAQQRRREADLVDQGGWEEFPALFDLEGNRVRAKLATIHPVKGCSWIDTKAWLFFDQFDRYTHKWITAFPVRASTMQRKGFKEGKELADAKVIIDGRGTGLSGSAWVATVRLDPGYPVDAKVVEF